LREFNTEGEKRNRCAFDVEPYATQFSLLRCVIRDYNSLPELTIYIGSKRFTIDHNVYFQNIYKGENGSPDFADLYIESVYDSKLFLGDGFFNRFYTFFDIENRKIGIAKNK